MARALTYQLQTSAIYSRTHQAATQACRHMAGADRETPTKPPQKPARLLAYDRNRWTGEGQTCGLSQGGGAMNAAPFWPNPLREAKAYLSIDY